MRYNIGMTQAEQATRTATTETLIDATYQAEVTMIAFLHNTYQITMRDRDDMVSAAWDRRDKMMVAFIPAV